MDDISDSSLTLRVLKDPPNLTTAGMLLHKKRVNYAAALIDDSIQGHPDYGRHLLFESGTFVHLCFAVYSHSLWRLLFYCIVLLHCFVVVWEEINIDKNYLGCIVVYISCLIVYIVDFLMRIISIGFSKCAREIWSMITVLLIVLSIVDLIVFFSVGSFHLRWSRPFLLLVRHRDLRRVYEIAQTLVPQLIPIFTVLTAFVFIMGAIGVHLFAPWYQDVNELKSIGLIYYEGAFDNTLRAALHIFVLVSGENYPSIMIPAFKFNRVSFLFFMIVIYIGMFFFLNLLLAVVLNFYWHKAKHQVMEEIKLERCGLVRAFDSLRLTEGRMFPDEFKELYRVLPQCPRRIEDAEIRFRFDLLDIQGTGYLEVADFLDITKILSLNVDTIKPESLHITGIWYKIRRSCYKFSSFYITRYFMAALIIINTIIFCSVWYDGEYRGNKSRTYSFNVVHTIFIVIQLLEMLTRLIGMSREFWWKQGNIADLVLLTSATALVIVFWTRDVPFANILAQILVIMRIGWTTLETRRGLSVLLRVMPVMFELTVLMMLFMYSFLMVSLDVFRNRNYVNPLTTTYGCQTGFDTLGCGALSLLHTLIGDNWQEIMLPTIQGEGWTASLFFLLYFVSLNLVIMTMLFAIVIETFFKAVSISNIFTNRGLVSFNSSTDIGVMIGITERLKGRTVTTHIDLLGIDDGECDILGDSIVKRSFHRAKQCKLSDSSERRRKPRAFRVTRKRGNWRHETTYDRDDIEVDTDELETLEKFMEEPSVIDSWKRRSKQREHFNAISCNNSNDPYYSLINVSLILYHYVLRINEAGGKTTVGGTLKVSKHLSGQQEEEEICQPLNDEELALQKHESADDLIKSV